MAFLPLSPAWLGRQAGVMNSAISHPTGTIGRLASRVRRVVAECNGATHRLTTLAGTPDRYPADPDRAPDTYTEFVIRTTGLRLPQEPERSARRP